MEITRREEWVSAYYGKRVLVTGHTGFKGSWLALWLSRLGARVTGYSLAPPTTPSNFALSQVAGVLSGHYEDDVRNTEALQAALRAARPQVVFHLAAQSLVRRSYAEPRETFDVNFMGTVAVLDAIRAFASPCAVVIVTSDKCYRSRPGSVAYREEDPMGGHDPYSASKGATELAVASYRRSFFPPDRIKQHGVALATVRAGNVIGGGDWASDRIMADVIRSLATGTVVAVRNPHAVRPWQHVLDPLGGYLALASRLMNSAAAAAFCGPWNFGPRPDDQVTVGQLVEMACRAWGQGAWEATGDPNAPHEEDCLRLSIDKATRDLNWHPRFSVTEAVERTVAWYRHYYDRPSSSMQDACMRDIAAYADARTPN